MNVYCACLIVLFSLSYNFLTLCGVAPLCFSISIHLAGSLHTQGQGLGLATQGVSQLRAQGLAAMLKKPASTFAEGMLMQQLLMW